MAGDRYFQFFICRHGAALPPVLQIHSDHLYLGNESRRASSYQSRRRSSESGSGGRTCMTGMYGLFETPELAQQAVDALRASGVPEHEITIQSSEPMEEYAFGTRDRNTLMPWLAVLGATIGMATGYYLTSITQQ